MTVCAGIQNSGTVLSSVKPTKADQSIEPITLFSDESAYLLQSSSHLSLHLWTAIKVGPNDVFIITLV